MKFSLKLPDDRQHKNPIVKGKLPISIFNQPFSSSFTSAVNSSSDLSFSLCTNFLSGPCLKLTYSPTPSSLAAAGAASTTPFSLCLKSGLGLFGSPVNSPLIFSAQFSLSLTKPVVPTFSLLFKPQFGHFCIKKSTVSYANPDHGFQPIDGAKSDSGSHSNTKFENGFSVDESTGWQELKLEPCSGKDSQENYGIHSNGRTGFEAQRHLVEAKNIRDGIFAGVAVMARTAIPVTKRLAVNLRWGMNFPASLATRMPDLTVNKISVERVGEEKEEKKQKVEGDMELLKGMLFWMKNDMEKLERENREMKQFLDDMKLGTMENKVSPSSSFSHGELQPWKKSSSCKEGRKSKNNINGVQETTDWRKKRNTEEENEGKNNRKYGEKNGLKGHNSSNRVNEVESELERAIKAASQVKA